MIIQRKSYRIAVFGISRSGKDATIEAFIKIAKDNGFDFVHMSPIGMVREDEWKGLKILNDTGKRDLARDVREEMRLSQVENVMVDEHYCFPYDLNGKILENGYYDEK